MAWVIDINADLVSLVYLDKLVPHATALTVPVAPSLLKLRPTLELDEVFIVFIGLVICSSPTPDTCELGTIPRLLSVFAIVSR